LIGIPRPSDPTNQFYTFFELTNLIILLFDGLDCKNYKFLAMLTFQPEVKTFAPLTHTVGLLICLISGRNLEAMNFPQAMKSYIEDEN